MTDPADLPAVAAPKRAAPHNQFLDLVRTVAIIRVLAWHTYGFAWLSYLIASMPAMFFVAGSLMAHSLERSSVRKVFYARFRRLLIPLWAFGLVMLSGMVLHSATQTELGLPVRWEQVPWWVFPLWDPQGSDWGITFWAVLWYMRCLTWLILLSPILLWLFKRLSIVLIGVPLGALAIFEMRSRAGDPVPWQFEDLALFGIFWLLGFSYNAGHFAEMSTRMRAVATVAFAGAAAAWVTTQDVPNLVVNASYPAHLLVGMTWLMGALTFEQALNQFALRAWPRRFISWVNDRIFTIYLWHAAGLFVMYEVLWIDDRPTWVRHVFALPIVLLVTFVCMLAFGWVEDLAARRELHLAPRADAPPQEPRPATSPAWRRTLLPLAAALGIVAILSGFLTEQHSDKSIAAAALVVPPSGVGIALRAEGAVILDEAPKIDTVQEGVVLPAVGRGQLQAVIDAWTVENGLAGATVALRRPDGSGWASASGKDVATGAALTADKLYPTASVTKTFTAALILQLVEEGKVDLDARASEYVKGIAHSDQYTVRQLIQHMSGLIATDAIGPAEALLEATHTSLQFEPGTGFLYSSPGYYMLGVIIEKVTGVPYTQALHERLLDPLGLSKTLMDEEIDPLPYSTHAQSNPALRSSSGVLRSSSGQATTGVIQYEYFGVLWSSAGLHSTVEDLAKWAVEYYATTDVVSEATRGQMTSFLGPEFQYAGLGTYPFCPCWKVDGRLVADRWGHYGRSGVMEYDPQDQIAFTLFTSGTDIDERLIVAYDDLSKRIRDLVRGRALPN